MYAPPDAPSPRTRPAAQVAFLLVALAVAGCSMIPSTSNNPDGDRVVVADGRSWGDDPFEIGQAVIEDDELSVEMSFGGGCKDHHFTLVIASEFAESDPVQLSAEIAHDANNDMCEAYLTQTRVFSLELVRKRYQDVYGPGEAKVALVIKGFAGGPLLYEFGG